MNNSPINSPPLPPTSEPIPASDPTPEEIAEWERRSAYAKAHPETNFSLDEVRANLASRVPASDQLREALNELLEARRFIASGEAKSFDEAAYMCNVEDAARAAVEELFGAQLGEIERLRRGLFGVERELADEIKRTTTREAELASLRSSALTAEEAAHICYECNEPHDQEHCVMCLWPVPQV